MIANNHKQINTTNKKKRDMGGLQIIFKQNFFKINRPEYKIFIFLGFFMIFLLLSGTASAAGFANTPQPKFHHDNNNTGQSQYLGPHTNSIKWKYQTGGYVESSPAIGSNGTIYIGSNDGYLYALNPAGTLKWKYQTENSITSSPAIGNDGTIYVGSNDSYLYAVNPTGTLKWKLKTLGPISSSPAIGSDGTVYVGGSDGYLYAVHPTGTLKWASNTYYPIYSSPAISNDGIIYIGNSVGLLAVDSTGNVKWSLDINSISSSPAIGRDGTVYVGSSNGYLYAIDNTGTIKLHYPTETIDLSSPAISNDGTVFFGSVEGYIYAISPTGTLKWRYLTEYGSTGNSIYSSPTVDSNGTLYIGSNNGYLYAIDSTGNLKWKYLTGGCVYSSPAIGSDGTLYIGSNDGILYALGIKDINPPTVKASLNSGLYNTNKIVSLNMSETGTIYYTLNGVNPTTASTKYTGRFIVSSSKILKFFAVDSAGNRSPIYTRYYTIDKIPPKIATTMPAINAINIPITSPITVKFTENIFKNTSYSKIYIKNLKTRKTVKITKSISSRFMTIKHYTFSHKTYYQIYIPIAAVKDKAGNLLNKTCIYKFKTK